MDQSKKLSSIHFLIIGIIFLCINKHAAGSTYKIGDPRSPEQCSDILDAVLVVDSSGSIGIDRWEQIIRPFLKDIVNYLDLGSNKVRLGLVLFGSYSLIKWGLGSEEAQNAAAFHRGIDVLEFLNSLTNTGLAFKDAMAILYYGKKSISRFNDQMVIVNTPLSALKMSKMKFKTNSARAHGAREEAPKLIILVTDGDPTDGDVSFNLADEFRSRGVTVAVVCIAQHFDKFCRQYAGCGPTGDCPLYASVNWGDMLGKLPSIMKKICKNIPQNAICNTYAGWTRCSATCGVGVRSRSRKHPITLKEAAEGDDNGTVALDCDAQDFVDRVTAEGLSTYDEYIEKQLNIMNAEHERLRSEDKISALQANAQRAAVEAVIKQPFKPHQKVEVCIMSPCPMDEECSNDFEDWSPCSVTCDHGVQERRRITLNNKPPSIGGRTCIEQGFPPVEMRDCFDMPCATDAECGEFGEWSSCSTTCGPGERRRERPIEHYNNPSAKNGGKDCAAQGMHQTETEFCSEMECPVDAECGNWSNWGSCSVTCGTGEQTRSRISWNDPAARNGGLDCASQGLEEHETQACHLAECPVDANCGTDFAEWSDCTVTCGTGERTRRRLQYNDPPAAHGGLTCEQQKIHEIESEMCNTNPCPENASCGELGNWSECTVTCGGGERVRSRDPDGYNNPPARFNGLTCEDQGYPLVETEPCNVQECPVDASCGEFGEWSDCSVTCGGGTMSRHRDLESYNNPPATNGGKTCEEQNLLEVETQTCNTQHCPIDAVCKMGEWSECDVTCGGGEKHRKLIIVEAEMFNGHSCFDLGFHQDEKEVCNEDPCPIDAKCGEWSDWLPCPVTCGGNPDSYHHDLQITNDSMPVISETQHDGGAVELRKRIGNELESEKYGGKSCLEQGKYPIDIRPCGRNSCPVDASCGEWGSWSECSVSCGGGGSRERHRVNYGVPPSLFGGRDCEEQGIHETEVDDQCNMEDCPIDAVPGEWNDWSSCSASCGHGHRHRTLEVLIHAMGGGKDLKDQNIETEQSETCFIMPCGPCTHPWTEWSMCSKTCGDGIKFRHTAIRYSNAIDECNVETMETATCNVADCPVTEQFENNSNEVTEEPVEPNDKYPTDYNELKEEEEEAPYNGRNAGLIAGGVLGALALLAIGGVAAYNFIPGKKSASKTDEYAPDVDGGDGSIVEEENISIDANSPFWQD